MSGSIAIIQPSYFEGWSTVVEDAKAMNQFVIASDIAVHKEQLKVNYCLFDPKNDQELAEKIEQRLVSAQPLEVVDYKTNVTAFASAFIKVME